MTEAVSCLLCQRACEAQAAMVWRHPEVEDCLVELVDAFGVSIEPPAVHAEDAPIAELEGDLVIDLNRFPRVEVVLGEIFAEVDMARLGGQSTGRGWSYYSLYQKCPYAWARRYVYETQHVFVVESPGLAVGTIVHTHLALYYANMGVDDPPLTPEVMHTKLLARCNPEYVLEGWRLFTAYRLFYEFEAIQPLAVEYDLVDPRTGFSCRYDLIAFLPEAVGDRPAGTYGFEHKTAQRFDRPTLEGWPNDGEVIGQVALWRRLGLDKRFGELQGMIVNLIGKQKEPRMHRTIVAPKSWQIDQHLKDLQRWDGLLNLARKFETFPRSRSSCVSRFGMCEWFDHCAGQE